jgi:hypothetical protein
MKMHDKITAGQGCGLVADGDFYTFVLCFFAFATFSGPASRALPCPDQVPIPLPVPGSGLAPNSIKYRHAL